MTKQEMKTAIKLAVKNGMGEKIRNIFVDLDTPTDAVIHVAVTYGRYGIDTVKFSLQHVNRGSKFYSIYSISGKANVHHISGINEQLLEVV